MWPGFSCGTHVPHGTASAVSKPLPLPLSLVLKHVFGAGSLGRCSVSGLRDSAPTKVLTCKAPVEKLEIVAVHPMQQLPEHPLQVKAGPVWVSSQVSLQRG